MVIDGFIEENSLAFPLLKRKSGPPKTDGPQEILNFPSCQQQDPKNFLALTKKYFWVDGGVYNDTNTESCRVGDQK